MRSRSASNGTAAEYAILAIACAVLFLRSYKDSLERPLWTDEALTAFAVTDDSLPHMLQGLHDETNALPPLSLAIGWFFTRIFGDSTFALRLPSVLFACLAIITLWWSLRRYVNRWMATWCAVFLPLASPHFLNHASEARCYSLYFTSYLMAVALYLRSAESRSCHGTIAWMSTLVHGLLVAAHYVGGLLSAMLATTALLEATAPPRGPAERLPSPEQGI